MEPQINISSGRPRLRNADGTRNIFCKRCRRKVGTVNNQNQNFGSVSACAVCLAAENGEILPEEVLEELKSERSVDGYWVPQFVFNEAKRQEEARRTDPMAPNVEDRMNSKYWFKAFGLKIVESVKELVTKGSGAQKLARDKKRARIFDRPIEDTLAEEDKS